MRVVGLDIHRVSAEAVMLDGGKLVRLGCVFHASWAPVPRDRGQQVHASWAGWRADAVMRSGAGFGVKGPG